MPTTAVVELYDVSYMEETTFGEQPTTPDMLELVQNSFTVRPERDLLESARRLGDGQVAINRLGRKRVAGEYEAELALTDVDDFLKAAWGVSAGFPTAFSEITGSTFTVDATGQTITDSNTGMGSVSVGDWVITAGFTNSQNNGVFYVTAAAAGSLTLAMGATALVDEAAGATITINQQLRIDNSTDVVSFFMEGRHDDINTFLRFKGVMVDSFSIEAGDGIATCRFGLIGTDFATATSTIDAPTLAAGNSPMDSLGGSFQLDAADARFRNVRFDMQRNRNLSRPLGTYISDEVFSGRCVVTGSFSVYMENRDLYDDFWSESLKTLRFSFIDPSGNYYTIYVYRALITDVTEEEEDEAVVYNCTFNALRHPTNLKTVGIAKVAV
jgi:hypothetical protein